MLTVHMNFKLKGWERIMMINFHNCRVFGCKLFHTQRQNPFSHGIYVNAVPRCWLGDTSKIKRRGFINVN